MAIRKTMGTNTREIRSASFCTGALVACARETRSMIWERTVSRPVLFTRMTIGESRASVAPVAWSPGPRCTGWDSPVIMDSSILLSPATMIPSLGMVSPPLTTSRSPALTELASMIRTVPLPAPVSAPSPVSDPGYALLLPVPAIAELSVEGSPMPESGIFCFCAVHSVP